jgi:hypothetical protein
LVASHLKKIRMGIGGAPALLIGVVGGGGILKSDLRPKWAEFPISLRPENNSNLNSAKNLA